MSVEKVTAEDLATLVSEAETEKVLKLHREAANLRQALIREKDRTEALYQATYDAATDVVSLFDIPRVPKPPKPKTKLRPEVPVACLGDWQIGKKTINYSSDIARERVTLFGEKFASIVAGYAHPVEEIHLWLLGDMVEGEDIFPGNQWLIDSSLYQQASVTGPEILSGFINQCLAIAQKVHVVGVIGNHGRIGRKGAMHPETNMDRMMYNITRMLFRDEERVTWEFAEPGNTGERGWHAVDRIGNYSCMLVHGDQFRGHAGIPWYGIRKKVLGWHAMSGTSGMPLEPFDDLMFGHWHQQVAWTINGIGVRGNGSTESYNDFAAENLAGAGRPTQRILFVDPEEGIVTAEYSEVYLDE